MILRYLLGLWGFFPPLTEISDLKKKDVGPSLKTVLAICLCRTLKNYRLEIIVIKLRLNLLRLTA